MSDEEKFDAIVVGAGLAGSTVALKLAKAGLQVLLVERGNYAGAKNMSGGRLYTHTLEKLLPDFREKAPLERKITKERISILEGNRGTTVDFTSEMATLSESYSVLRGTFDRWLCEEAENEGAMVVSGIQANELLKDGNRVVGIRSGEDEFYADVVVIADGVNSILAEKAELRQRVIPTQMAVGAKDVYKLDAKTISDRFNVTDSDGAAWLFMGDFTYGLMGGGFIYTNKDTLSVGMVVGLSEIGKIRHNVEEMMNKFAEHPTVAPLLAGATLVERSGHVVPEGGWHCISTLSGDGFVIVGDAAGLCMNLGFTVRGMDLAIESGLCAADAILTAHRMQDYSAKRLRLYDDLFLSSACGKDMKHYQNMPHFMENPRIFQMYPAMVNSLMADVFTLNPNGATPLMNTLLKRVKSAGPLGLAMDVLKGVRSL